jgi:hypothetical protein
MSGRERNPVPTTIDATVSTDGEDIAQPQTRRGRARTPARTPARARQTLAAIGAVAATAAVLAAASSIAGHGG